MRVLGVDPGLTRCGIGVVDGGPGQAPRAVEVVVVRTPADADLAVRLLQIAERVEAMMDRHRPDTVAIERVFSQHNVRTVMGTAQASPGWSRSPPPGAAFRSPGTPRARSRRPCPGTATRTRRRSPR